MTKNSNSSPNLNCRRRGFTLTELAIVLAVLGLLIGGLFQLTAASSRAIQDQVIAQQIQLYLRATKSYLASRMQVGPGVPAAVNIGNASVPADPVTALAVNSVTNITARVQDFRTGLAVIAPQNGTYQVRLRRLNDVVTSSGNEPAFTIGVFIIGGNAVQRPQLGSIATLVGAEGAGVYDGATLGEVDNPGTTSCDESGVHIRGAFGATCINATVMDGGLGLPTSERPAALASGSLNDFASGSSQWLSRTEVAGAPQLTTMSADLRMGAGDNDILMADNQADLVMAGGALNDTAGNLRVSDGLEIVGANNFVLNGGAISDNVGAVTISDPLVVTGPSIALSGAIVPNGGGGVTGITFHNGATAIPLLAGTAGTPPEANLGITGSLSVSNTLRAASFVYSSDARLKKDIVPLQATLDKMLNIRGVKFTYKNTGKTTLGVIAQEVEKSFPELIDYDEKGYKMVNYGGLVAPMLEAMRELREENQNLKARLERLEQKTKE